MEWTRKRITTVVVGIIVVIVVLASWPFVIIGAGERGVVLRWGAVQDKIFDEGFHVKTPFADRVIKVDVKIQKSETRASAASKDMQIVTTVIAINYHQDPGRVNWIHQNIGKEFKDRIISPAVDEGLKASTAQFTAAQLITQRPAVKALVDEFLKERLSKYGLIVDEISLTDFDFSTEYNKAIEAKQVAEQNAKKAEWELEQKKVEAQRRVAEAKADAEAKIAIATAEAEAIRVKAIAEARAIEIRGEALRKNPELVKLEAVQRWDGVLPKFTGGGAIPFIDVANVTEKE